MKAAIGKRETEKWKQTPPFPIQQQILQQQQQQIEDQTSTQININTPGEQTSQPINPPTSLIDTTSSLTPSITSRPDGAGAKSSVQPLSWQWNADSFDREYELYTRIAVEEEKVTPELVKQFRLGKFDWHNLLPNYPKSGHGDLDFSRLVASEVATTKFLTYDFSLHHYWNWGKDHGPLKEFSSCRKVYDKCSIHPKADCLNNGLCGWCEKSQICIDRMGKPLPYDEHEHKTACPLDELLVGPQNMNLQCQGQVMRFEGGFGRSQDNSNGCKLMLTDRLLQTSLNPNAGSMYYHFLSEHFEPWYEQNFASGKIRDRYSHVVITDGSMDHFHDYFGIFTRICPRYAREISDGTCFCQHPPSTAAQAIIPPEGVLPVTKRLVDAMVNNLGLQDVYPSPHRPAIALLSRENKRFILNELELARIAVENGVSIKLLPLEFMTIYEQIREFRRVHILSGIHGSGLTNYFLLHNNDQPRPGGLAGYEPNAHSTAAGMSDANFASLLSRKRGFVNYCLQLMPHRVAIGGGGLRGFAQRSGCQYEEWIQPKRANTVLHTHFLNRNDFTRLEELMQHVSWTITITTKKMEQGCNQIGFPDNSKANPPPSVKRLMSNNTSFVSLLVVAVVARVQFTRIVHSSPFG